MEIKIREILPGDAFKVINYVKKVSDETSFLTFSSDEFNKSIVEEQKIIATFAASPNQLFIMAEHEGKMVGLLHVEASHKKRLKHIGEFGITVAKEYWGKGVGTQLIEYMIHWARESGIIRKINLKVIITNEKAVSLYKKFGFKIEGQISRDAFVDDVFLDTYCMGLEID